MKTKLTVLSKNEKTKIHQHSLDVLENVGIRVESELARKHFANSGAQVDNSSKIVKIPRNIVEDALKITPKDLVLGARRPGWELNLDNSDCWLMADGEASTTLDFNTGLHRKSTFKDWLTATKLTDAIDEIGSYWAMVEVYLGGGSKSDYIKYWHALFGNFSKHIQDPINHKDYAPLFLEVLQIVYGSKKEIIKKKPLSFLICPQSPLSLDEQYTDACLAMTGWGIPVAIMPMPLMGGTAPGTMVSTTVIGNSEILATICLLQAADPGWPIIYAATLASMNPRTGLYSAGSVDNALLSVAAIEMGRYYGLPVEGTGGGTDHYVPGIQAGYERALTAMMPVMAWPDILVGPGMLGGSMVLSLEQIIIDVEVFCASKHAANGINASADKFLISDIHDVGPNGHYLSKRSTINAMRSDEWFHAKIGHHNTIESWESNGRPRMLSEAHEKVKEILKNHNPVPLTDEMNSEFLKLQKFALENK